MFSPQRLLLVSPGKGSPGVFEKEPTSQTKPEALGKAWEAMAMSGVGQDYIRALLAHQTEGVGSSQTCVVASKIVPGCKARCLFQGAYSDIWDSWKFLHCDPLGANSTILNPHWSLDS